MNNQIQALFDAMAYKYPYKCEVKYHNMVFDVTFDGKRMNIKAKSILWVNYQHSVWRILYRAYKKQYPNADWGATRTEKVYFVGVVSPQRRSRPSAKPRPYKKRASPTPKEEPPLRLGAVFMTLVIVVLFLLKLMS